MKGNKSRGKRIQPILFELNIGKEKEGNTINIVWIREGKHYTLVMILPII